MNGRTGYVLIPGVLIEPLGEQWAAFSPASGESHLLNDTSAAVVELLSCERPLTEEQACAALADTLGTLSAEEETHVISALQSFIAAGLARTESLPGLTQP